ncbi:MAG TPA: histone deacetylase [Haliangiales bacterium]|nr:histone deacetylase [Haliangiales bacterium]
MKIITDSRCTAYSTRGHPERPERVSRTVERLKNQVELPVSWVEPLPVDEAIIELAHSKEHVARVKAAAADFDGDTPAHADIFAHACRSVGGALQAMQSAQKGEPAFSLLRPPGHHATRDRAMGFCYLNSIAITALEALATGTRKVAVLDFDVHHGNGTEAILTNRPGAVFFSIHQYPCYPGTGTGHVGDNCFNYPVAPETPREDYRKVLKRALDELKNARPALVAVSAGFDAYARDPIAQETLEAEDFQWLGQSIRDLGIPAFSVLEGGYSRDLPELILAYLKGIEGL